MGAKPVVIFPGGKADLLRQELLLALSIKGFSVIQPPSGALLDPETEWFLPEILRGGGSFLFLSINFKGLEGKTTVFRMLREAGVPVAVWCVDNPWNLLSAVRGPEWKESRIFVTDKSFVQPLREAGANAAHHLPLAGCLASMGPHSGRDRRFPPPSGLAPLVFVGRPSFPGRSAFFAGLELPSGALEKADAELRSGRRPDFGWWLQELGFAGQPLWPGKKARLASLGAQESNRIFRVMVLEEAASFGLTVFGEQEGFSGTDSWRFLLPEAVDIRPAVDYYSRLPGVYAGAEFSLNLDSLLLPCGLTQRIFDVWLAGGFCFTGSGPGLEIFPSELTEPISFGKAEDMLRSADYFRRRPGRKAELARAWREHVLQNHSYVHRIEFIMEHAC